MSTGSNSFFHRQKAAPPAAFFIGNKMRSIAAIQRSITERYYVRVNPAFFLKILEKPVVS